MNRMDDYFFRVFADHNSDFIARALFFIDNSAFAEIALVAKTLLKRRFWLDNDFVAFFKVLKVILEANLAFLPVAFL